MHFIVLQARKGRHLTLRSLLLTALVISLALWAGFPLFFDDEYVISHFSPDGLALALYVFGIVCLSTVRSNLMIFHGFVWLIWVVVGAYFCVGHFFQGKLWAPIYLNEANHIFLVFVILMIIGMKLWEVIEQQRQPAPQLKAFTPLEALPLLLFPMLYAISLLMTGFTIFSGGVITDDMYSVDRGPLYGLRIALVLFFAYSSVLQSRLHGRFRIAFLAFVGLCFIFAVLDGKRDMAILGVLAMVYMVLYRSGGSSALKSMLVILLTVALYGAIASLRSGLEFENRGWVEIVTIAGIEFRDYAHSVNYWSPAYVQGSGFDYVKSSVAMLLNSAVLQGFGVDKNAWIALDSARTWQRMFQSDFGIRIGLVGELYYATGGWPYPLALIFGLVSGFVFSRVDKVRGELSLMFTVTICAGLTLAVFSQSSAFFGYLLTLVYLWIIIKTWTTIVSHLPRVSYS